MAHGQSLILNEIQPKVTMLYSDKIPLRSKKRDAKRAACAALGCTPKQLKKMLRRWRDA